MAVPIPRRNMFTLMSYTVKRLLADSPETSTYVPSFCPKSEYMFKSVTLIGVRKKKGAK